MKRFLALECHLRGLPDIQKQYCHFLREYEDLGHLKRTREDEIPTENFFLPHHCVIRPESSSTKLRVVFDASAKSDNGVSLNDILCTGPTIQDDLFSILLRFRMHKYVIVADIVKMFRQFKVSDENTYFQLIFWRDSPDKPIDIYRLLTVTYGEAAAPFLAARCLQQLAQDERENFPLASKITLKDYYVDNLLSGAGDTITLQRIKIEMNDMLKTAGLQLKKWCSNDDSVLKDIPLEDQETHCIIDGNDTIKTLGMLYQPKADNFKFQIRTPNATKRHTKRSVLSETARIFDPLGLIGPIITTAKLFMQKLWQLNVHWDEALPQDLATHWQTFRTDLNKINGLKIYRPVSQNTTEANLQLHGFSDASEKAYGAAFYLRRETVTGQIEVNLFCAKSRVAPSRKTTTLPRLELCAAELLSQLLKRIRDATNLSAVPTYCWTDSSIVLAWISATPDRWKRFVATRVSQIQQLSKDATWAHVPTKDNPADIISRGTTPTRILDGEIHRLWYQGPQFLSLRISQWPTFDQQCHTAEIPEENKTNCTMTTLQEHTDLFGNSKYLNDYTILVRIAAYVVRFTVNVRQKKEVENWTY